jgi:hypothetical protein
MWPQTSRWSLQVAGYFLISSRTYFPALPPRADQQIRAAIVHLQQWCSAATMRKEGDSEVERTFRLFDGILSDAHERKGIEPAGELLLPQREWERSARPDPNYTMRAWRGVLTYLLRQEEFLYE